MIVLTILAAFFMVWLIKELTMGICLSMKRLDGRVVVITGGTSGIGFETTVDLAKRGATVIFTSRNMKKGLETEAEVKRLSGSDKIHFMSLDLASQKDTQRFAVELKRAHSKIDFLINNAGIAADLDGSNVETKDGFDLVMATNVLGHFTLTEMLLDTIKATADDSDKTCRVVHVSSLLHCLDNLDSYSESKLYQIWYSNDLAHRLMRSGVESVSLHPGLVRTNIFYRVNNSSSKSRLLSIAAWLIGKTPWQGAQTTIEAVVSDEDLNGKYLSDCRQSWLKAWWKMAQSKEDLVKFRHKIRLSIEAVLPVPV